MTKLNWKKQNSRGQDALGYVDIYETDGTDKVISVIHYLPQHTHTQQRVVLTVVLEGERSKWTDGTIDGIFEFAENEVKANSLTKFKNQTVLPHLDTQLFTVKNIEEFEYFNHGDKSF
jgi:hypothetical protein